MGEINSNLIDETNSDLIDQIFRRGSTILSDALSNFSKIKSLKGHITSNTLNYSVLALLG